MTVKPLEYFETMISFMSYWKNQSPVICQRFLLIVYMGTPLPYLSPLASSSLSEVYIVRC